MQYPFYTILELITMSATLFLGMSTFYFLIKRWKDLNFLTALKIILFYSIGITVVSFIINSLIPSANTFLRLLVSIFTIGASFGVYYFLTNKFLELKLKNIILSFLIVIMITMPILGFLRSIAINQFTEMPFLREETEAMQLYFWEKTGGNPFISNVRINSVPLVITAEIEKAVFSLPINLFINIELVF